MTFPLNSRGQNSLFAIFDRELCSKVLKEALLLLLLLLLLAWNQVKKMLQNGTKKFREQNLFHNEQKAFQCNGNKKCSPTEFVPYKKKVTKDKRNKNVRNESHEIKMAFYCRG